MKNTSIKCYDIYACHLVKKGAYPRPSDHCTVSNIMPRFHFNIYDGSSQPDNEGTDMPDWQAVRLEAIRLAGQTIADGARSIASDRDWHMEVTDDKGLVLFRVDFNVTESPLVMKML